MFPEYLLKLLSLGNQEFGPPAKGNDKIIGLLPLGLSRATADISSWPENILTVSFRESTKYRIQRIKSVRRMDPDLPRKRSYRDTSQTAGWATQQMQSGGPARFTKHCPFPLSCVSKFTCWNVIPTVIAEPPLFLVGGDAPLDLQVSRGLHRAVVEVAAGTRPLTQVAAGQGITCFKLQEKQVFKA